MTQSLRCESQILGSRTAASITVITYACDSQTQTTTNGEWANHVDSVLLECLDSDTDVSVVIVLSPITQPATKLLQTHS